MSDNVVVPLDARNRPEKAERVAALSAGAGASLPLRLRQRSEHVGPGTDGALMLEAARRIDAITTRLTGMDGLDERLDDFRLLPLRDAMAELDARLNELLALEHLVREMTKALALMVEVS